MGAEALKLELLDWLLHVDNNDMLHYLKVIKDQTTSQTDWWDELTDEQKAGIERGIKDIESGRVVSHEVVKNKYGL
ncbi:hypothetical protein H9X57_05665 [Flavobacterium piscinae]|uniref:Addiction module protein n=1 Tax=Flavobacterium piscinae TaxID=2506424 RepID=A0A4Q1KJ83_9FLAO|nr:hypothetical protein [Flavobacterium piscinae]MBC8883059.1 hypothetical protein [Flavobacterium piscinae]RXR29415.1 hypothetical protein EQG68_13090 [Flavobacterium piscinae]